MTLDMQLLFVSGTYLVMFFGIPVIVAVDGWRRKYKNREKP